MKQQLDSGKLAQSLDRHAHARQLREAYSGIATGEAVCEGRTEEAFRLICKTVAECMSLDYCSIWLLSDNNDLVCHELYELETGSFSEGGMIPANKIPKYLDHLQQHMVLETDDAQLDDRCSELLHDYLVPRNVGAMLDSAIRLDGAMRGVICCESIGKRRSWLEEEIFFMRALADQVSLTLGNRVRQEAVALIKRNDSFFRDLFEDSPLGITIRDANGRLLVSNSAWQRIWALPDDFISRLQDANANYDGPDWSGFAIYSDEDMRRINQVMQRGGLVILPEVKTLNRPEPAAKWVSQHLYVTRDEADSGRRIVGITEDITDRKHTKDMLEQLAASLEAATGAEFFRILTSRLCTALGVSHAYICRLDADSFNEIETIAACEDGRQVDNIRFDISHTPCEQVIAGGPGHHVDRVQELFPEDSKLAEMGVRSFMGMPLRNSEGRILGLIAIYARKPIASPESAMRFLQVLSSRCAAELERLMAQSEHSESEERFRIAMTTMNEGMVMLDAEGRISMVNEVTASLIGLPRYRIEGREAEDIVAERSRTMYAEEKAERRAGKSGTYEGDLLTATGDSIPVRVNATPLLSADGRFMGSIAILTDLRGKLREEQAAREHREQMRRITAELVLAEERERRRLATNLHDGIGHSLSTLAMLLESISANEAEDVRRVAQRGLQITGEAQESTRGLVFELSPPVLHELGLLPALRWLAEQTTHVHGIPVKVIDNGNSPQLDEQVRVLLYQSVRELLFNAVKYSRASSVILSLEGREDGVRIGVSDDGIGFEFDDLMAGNEESRGYGLYSINERMNHVGGLLEINSRPGEGASFHLNAPCRITSNSEGHGAETKPEQPQPRSGRADQLKVLIVDDQQLIRQGIRSILSADPNISICGEAENGRKAIELARSTRPDIILMDIDMPEMNGVSATQRIMEMLPDTRVLGLSLQEEITVVGEMLAAGARGYLLKNHVERDLVPAIHAMSENLSFLSSQITQRIVNDYIAETVGRRALSLEVLTERELEILRMVMDGEPSKSIAIQLDISIRTVETHRRNIMKKLGVNSLPELIRLAIREGMEI